MCACVHTFRRMHSLLAIKVVSCSTNERDTGAATMRAPHWVGRAVGVANNTPASLSPYARALYVNVITTVGTISRAINYLPAILVTRVTLA